MTQRAEATRTLPKIALRTLAAIFVAIIAVMVAINHPAVQTIFARRAIGMFHDKLGGSISVGKVHVKFLDAISLQDIVILDDTPYEASWCAPADTFARIGSLSARFSLRGLWHGDAIEIWDAKLNDAFIVLTTEPDPSDSTLGTSNLKRIFGLGKSEKDKEKTDKEIFNIRRMRVSDVSFTMRNYRSHKSGQDGVVNWSDLQASGISVRGRNISMRGKVLEATADAISMTERSGLSISELSGKAKVGDGRAVIEDLMLGDGATKLHMPAFQMSYPDGFEDFIDNVHLEAELDNSVVSMNTLGHLAAGLQKMTLRARLDGEIDGYVSDLVLDGIKFTDLDGGLSATLDGRISGLPDAGEMILDASISDAEFSTRQLSDFITSLAPSSNLDLGKFAPRDTLKLEATASGPINDLAVGANGEGVGGSFTADLDVRNLLDSAKAMELDGSISTSALDVGSLLDNGQFGTCSMYAHLAAALGNGATSLLVDTLEIGRFGFHGHDYRDISGMAQIDGKDIYASLTSMDKSLRMNLDASSVHCSDSTTSYKGNIKLAEADLAELGFGLQETSKVSLEADVDLTMTGGMLDGSAKISGLTLTDDRGRHDFGDMTLDCAADGETGSMRLRSSMLDADYTGTAFVGEFISDIQRLTTRRELPAMFPSADTIFSGNSYSLRLELHEKADELLGHFSPDAYLADSTSIAMDITSGGVLNGAITSPRVAMGTKYTKGTVISIGNSSGELMLDLTADEINVSPITLHSNKLTASVHDNGFGVKMSYDNATELRNSGELDISGKLGRSTADSLTLEATISPSRLYVNSDPWTIHAGGIRLDGGHIKVEDMAVDGDGKSIVMDGGFSTSYVDSLHMDMDRFDLDLLNTFMKQDMDIQGLATGKAVLISPVGSGKIGMLMGLQVDSASISGHKLGTLEMGSSWDDSVNGLRLAIRNKLEGNRTISTAGYFSPASGAMDLTAKMNGFDLGIAEPFLAGIFSEFGGGLSGSVRVYGKTNAMELESDDLRLDDAFLKVDFTGVRYGLSGPLSITSDGVYFNDIAMTDDEDGKGVVSGGLRWNRLKDIVMDTKIRFSQMEVLDLAAGVNSSFYGHAYAGGNVSVTGPFKQLNLNVNARTTKNGEFHIPLSSGGTTAKSDLLTFIDPHAQEAWIDPYEKKMGIGETQTKSSGDLGIKLTVNVGQDMTAYIDLDDAAENSLWANGQGSIEVNVRPQRGVFTLGGNYDVSDGKVHINVLDVAKRDLSIQDGSAVRFNGEVMDTDLDVSAAYTVKTNIGTLIADTTSTSRREVNAIIGVSGRLSNPSIEFDVDIPDLDPSTQAQVDAALNTDDKKQKQVLSLLVSGGFLPDETSGVVNNTSMLSSSITEIMSGQLNTILQKLNIPVDLGLDYQSTSSGKSIYDVAVSTALFNNRVIVNGTIGNREYTSGASSSDVVGDLDVEIKLDKQGALRLNLFSHSADQYTSYLDNSQRNGMGITYQRDFNNLRQFVRRMFSRKPKRQEQDLMLQREERALPKRVVRLGGEPLPDSLANPTLPMPPDASAR